MASNARRRVLLHLTPAGGAIAPDCPGEHKTGSPAYPTPAQRLSDKRYLVAYVFIHVERRSPRHVHVYRDGKLIVWDLDHQKAPTGLNAKRADSLTSRRYPWSRFEPTMR
jgi:hypothetical protein